MPRRVKKPAVRPELRRQWLRRSEEEGESAPHIAEADGFDVRTVRKQIEMERQERERREARSMVLRRALEQHYADLCAFAQKLDSQVTGSSGTLSMMRNEPMWSALREHMPRGTMWKNLDRWDSVQNEISQLQNKVEKQVEELVKAKSAWGFRQTPDEVGVAHTFISAVASHFRLVAQGLAGLAHRTGFHIDAADDKGVWLQLGRYTIGKVPRDQEEELKTWVIQLLNEVTTWQEQDNLSRLFTELKRIEKALHEELLVIILRRVIPGRCRYCPL